MNAEVFEKEMQKVTTYGACDGPSSLSRSVGGIVEKLLKEDGEVWPKCRITKFMTDHHSHDGSSHWFVMMIREVVQYPNSKSLSVMERRPSTDRRACDGPSYLFVEDNEESSRRICKV